jgi:predicted O-methyltransferase YrrM
MGVPTFAASAAPTKNLDCAENVQFTSDPMLADRKKSRGLEGVLNHGPAFVVDDVLTKEACEQIIADCQQLGFGNFNSGKNVHGAQQIVVDPSTADAIARQLAPHIDVNELERLRREMITKGNSHGTGTEHQDDIRLFMKGLNRRWRIYRYEPSGEESFAPHIDAGFPPSGISESGKSLVWDDSASLMSEDDDEVVSRLTVLMYLNDDFVGGETKFFPSQSLQRDDEHAMFSSPIASVRPIAGSVLLFPQGVGEDAVEYARANWPLHEGSPVRSGRPKYVIRSDVLFATHVEKPPFEDDEILFRHDNTVRQTFVPKPSLWDQNFLSQVGLLYNPCMGVENLGPFLYSFLRMTKRRRVVEIGAGYTTLWILQALKDNDIEMQSIRSIQRDGECKLLNIDWTIHETVEDFDSEPSKLLCIDNCEHQRETASGAGLVAKSLGLDSYLEFRRGDAFDMKLPDSTVDVLWCDFGVGARMQEFISSAWDCISPGGFLLCHSTLTNENTRAWLEAVRNGEPKEVTGIEGYTELSLLESHKRFQNSVSIIQKRRSTEGDTYEEPIYSQYA